MNILMTILFVVTFYFTILRQITTLKIFDFYINSFNKALNIEENYLTIIIIWLMWFYQIYFWFSYFKII